MNNIPGIQFLSIKPKAIIVPHAGYIYSGFTANAAHRALANTKPKRVIVIGPSHYVFLKGISAAFTNKYETPCGYLETDTAYLDELNKRFHFIYSEKAHYKEHSTETQMPFIKHYNPQTKIIELIYGEVAREELAEVISYVLSDKDTAVVISTDLSHFYPLDKANSLDAFCLEAIKKKDISILSKGCQACGITGLKALLDVASRLQLQTAILDYSTSASSSGDVGSVVGYASAVLWPEQL